MNINIFPLPPLGANCILVSNDNNELYIFDPGIDRNNTLDFFIQNHNLTPKAIYLTHGHFDHVSGIERLKEKYNLPVYIHKDDEELLSYASEVCKNYGYQIKQPKITGNIKDGDIINLGDNLIIKVLHTPGHTQGGVSYYIPSLETVITGDTLFHETVGRTDLEGGNLEQLENSIRKKLYVLPPNTVVIPGHSIKTTIGHEKVNNPEVKDA